MMITYGVYWLLLLFVQALRTIAVGQGLFAFTPVDGAMLIANADDSQPKIW